MTPQINITLNQLQTLGDLLTNIDEIKHSPASEQIMPHLIAQGYSTLEQIAGEHSTSLFGEVQYPAGNQDLYQELAETNQYYLLKSEFKNGKTKSLCIVKNGIKLEWQVNFWKDAILASITCKSLINACDLYESLSLGDNIRIQDDSDNLAPYGAKPICEACE
jgi:hypothetical protein